VDFPSFSTNFKLLNIQDPLALCYFVPMVEKDETDFVHRDVLERLLGRGSTMLTLAVVAYSRGFRPATVGQWNVLSKEMQAAAEQILSAVASNPFPKVLEQALTFALAPLSETAVPSWLSPIYRDPSALSAVGRAFETARLTASLGEQRIAPSDREKGLAAVALALCRLQDTLASLSRRLPSVEEAVRLMRMGRLAYVRAGGGEPSAARTEIRKLLNGAPWEE
jgi:hypothetical protein